VKILMLLEKWGYEGGREHHNVSMLRAFLERGYRCSLAYGIETDKRVNDPYFSGVPKHCDPALPFFSHRNDQTHLSELLHYIDREGPDVVYIGHIRNLRTLEEINGKCPTIVMVQDLWLICLRECKTYFLRRKPCGSKLGLGCLLHGCFLGKARKPNELLRYNSLSSLLSIKDIYKSFGTIVVTSRFMRQSLIANGFDGNRIHVLGCFDEDFPVTSAPLPAKGNVLFLGRIDRYKGLDILAKAMTKCKSDARLVVVGDGPFLPKVKQVVRALGMEKRVDFMGWVPHKELANQFGAATIVAVPSIWPEPLGKVGIEAMAHARPVVAFDVGGISDWLEHGKTGYLVPWKDINVMASAIDNVYQDVERSRQMGNLGRETVRRKFMKKGYLDCWESLIPDAILRFKTQRSS